VWHFSLPLIESSPLLGRGELEVAQLHRRAQVGRCLAQSGALVAAPEAVVDHDIVPQRQDAQPDLDEPSFDHVAGRWRILVPVERLHPFVLGEAKRLLLDLDAPSGGGLPGARESHGQEQCRLPHHHPFHRHAESFTGH
jgi:hypothetical protein